MYLFGFALSYLLVKLQIIKKKRTTTRGRFFNPDTGQVNRFLAVSEKASEQAFDVLIEQLTTDPDTFKSVLDGIEWEETFNKMLLEGNDKDVRDDVFFKALEFFGYEILSRPMAQQKMARWQREKRDKNGDVAFKAQNNLKKIGTSLAAIGHDRNAIRKGFVAVAWELYHAKLKANRNRIRTKHSSLYVKRILREIMTTAPFDFMKPTEEQIDAILNDERFDTIWNKEASLADHIIAKLFNISPETVRQNRKETKILPGVYSFQ